MVELFAIKVSEIKYKKLMVSREFGALICKCKISLSPVYNFFRQSYLKISVDIYDLF